MQSLAGRLRDGERVAPDIAAQIVEGVLEEVARFHSAGVVLRTFGPSNVELERDVDSGLMRVRVLDRSNPEDGFAYLAPEQARGGVLVDERADVYAVGVLTFRLLTGRLPQTGPALVQIAAKLEHAPPTLGAATSEAWSAGLERFVARCLARDRADRPTSATLALEEWTRAVVHLRS